MTEPAVSAFERFKSRVVGVLPAHTAKCWLFHKWGPWHTGNTAPMFGPTGNFMGVFVIQSKWCARCQKVQLAVARAKL